MGRLTNGSPLRVVIAALFAAVTLALTSTSAAAEDGGGSGTTVPREQIDAVIDHLEDCFALTGPEAAECYRVMLEPGAPGSRPAQPPGPASTVPERTVPADTTARSGVGEEPAPLPARDATQRVSTGSAWSGNTRVSFFTVTVGIVVILGLVRVYLVIRERRAAKKAAAGEQPRPGALPGTMGSDRMAQHDRQQLVAALVDLYDIVPSKALRQEIILRLATVGVEPLVPASGEPFDPSSQRGVHAASAADRGLDGTVADCDRPGWVDRGEVVRPPEVVVNRWSGT